MTTNPQETTPTGTSSRPCYRSLAARLLQGLPPGLAPEQLPPPWKIARWYQIPVATAQFVRRAAVTRLRPPLRLLPEDPACPAWVGLAADLRARIRAGRLSGRMPGRKPLAAAYGVGVDTVGKALVLLADEQLIEIRPGAKGTYVSRGALEQRGAGRHGARKSGTNNP
ncbi:GntR family transcriptional regulator [Kitasatospora sp. NPDC003701]